MASHAGAVNSQQNPIERLWGEATTRLHDVMAQTESGAFRNSLDESFWMMLPYIALSIPIEIAIDKAIIPGLNKIYQKVSGKPDAEIPRIAQSIFKGIGLFAWFPAILIADATKKFVNYNHEMVEPEARAHLVHGIANAAIFRDDVKNGIENITLPEAGANPVGKLIEIIFDSKDAHRKKTGERLLERLGADDSNRELMKFILDGLAHPSVFDNRANQLAMTNAADAAKANISGLLEVVQPKAKEGFIQRVLGGESSPDDVQSALLLVHGLLFNNFTKNSGNGNDITIFQKRISGGKSRIIREIRDLAREVQPQIQNAEQPDEQLEAWQKVATRGLGHILLLLQGTSHEKLENMVSSFDYKTVHQQSHSFNMAA